MDRFTVPAATTTISFRLALALIALLTLGGPARADLASHRAIYSISLASSEYGSDVAAITGKMALEVADGCDGWTFRQRIVQRIVSLEGAEIQSSSNFASWESKDGTRFRFEQRTLRNGETIAEFSGRAVMEGVKGGVAYYTKPEKREIALPPGTLFPTMHTVRLIERARAGDRNFLSTVFDGSNFDNPNRVNAFIGPSQKLPGLTEDAGPETSWPIRLAFFPLTHVAMEPDVEIGVLLQDDGIVREVEFDYGSSRIRGELEQFEIIPPVPC